MSEQFRTDNSTPRPPSERVLDSILEKGPRYTGNSRIAKLVSSLASKDAEPAMAFHLPSGEQERRLHVDFNSPPSDRYYQCQVVPRPNGHAGDFDASVRYS